MGQERDDTGLVEFSGRNPEDGEALYGALRGVPGVRLEAVAAPVAAGEQGAAFDLVTVACSSGAATVVLQIIKVLIESRGPKFSLKVRRGKDRLEITADNLDEVLPVLKELLGGP
jgi:Effector Associated Constant Component 1